MKIDHFSDEHSPLRKVTRHAKYAIQKEQEGYRYENISEEYRCRKIFPLDLHFIFFTSAPHITL